MSPTDDHLPNIDDARIDLLVDGELSETERREVLLTLEETSDGWRRCALAFLEGQSWKEEMRAIGREEVSAPQAVRPAGHRRFWSGRWGTLLAMAASFLVALGLGLFLRDGWPAGVQSGAGPSQIAGTPAGPEQQAAEAKQPDTSPGSDTALDSPTVTWVSIPTGAEGGGSIRIPAIRRERIDDGWLEGFPAPTLPADLLEALRRSGHQVRRSRQWFRLPMEDARQLVVPVDEFQFRYVGNSAYQ